MSGLATLFTVLGIAWAVQLFFAWRQAQRFQKQLSTLRNEGIVAIGLGGHRYRGGRAYVALVADENGIIKDGLLLTGMTVIAKGKPFADYKGFHIKEIISGDRVAANRKPKVIAAAKMAAEHIEGHLSRKDVE
jgi:DNA-binding transcriptional regulator of glucitol operon